MFGLVNYFIVNKSFDGLRNLFVSSISSVSCSVKNDTPLIPNSFFNYKLFVSTLDSNKSYIKGQDSYTRRFSLKDYSNDLKDLKEDLVFYVNRQDSQPVFDMGLEMSLQLCDSNNKTVSTEFIPAKINGQTEIVLYGRDPIYLPLVPGTYRVDGLIKVKGQVQLISRINEVVFTD